MTDYHGVTRSPFRQTAPFLVAILAVLPLAAFADNQCIVKTIGSPNPSPMVENGVLYLYCTEDSTGNAGGAIVNNNQHCWTTTDLFHWKDSGVVLREANVPWTAKTHAMWAPTVMKLPDGMFHLYFPETATDGNHHVGHAKAARPTGPFIADATYMKGPGNNAIDPFCIVDTGSGGSGKVYLEWCITGITPNQLYMGVLNPTFDSIVGTPTQLTISQFYPDGNHYVEGMWLIKQNNLWYHFHAVYYPGSLEQIAYSTASSLTGPYTYRAMLMGPNSNSVDGTIHPGVCFFNNRWIMFWHSGGNELGGAISVNSGAKRVACAEYFSFDTTTTPWKIKGVGTTKDDTIMKTMRGVGIPNAYRDTIQIDRMTSKSGDSVMVVGGGEPLGWMMSFITNKGWVLYDSVDFTPDTGTSGPVTISLRVASTVATDSIDVRLGASVGPLLKTFPVPSTGSLTTWTTISDTVTMNVTGLENVALLFHIPSGSANLNVNWVTSSRVKKTPAINEIRVAPAGFALRRINKNTFSIVSDDGAAPRIRLLTLDGKDAGNALESVTAAGKTVTFTLAPNRLAPGAYILSIVTRTGTRQMPFVY